MKYLILALFLITIMAMPCFAQCVAEIKDVYKDPVRGSIVVETEYTLNGEVVQLGQTRYKRKSGTNLEIKAYARKAAREHCRNLIKRINENATFIRAEMLSRVGGLRQGRTIEGIISNIKDDLIGYQTTQTEATKTFRGKDINVTFDKNNTVTDNTTSIE